MRFTVARSAIRPGESWARAADRIGGDPRGPVLAVDLSGDPLVFAVEPELRIACRPMTRGDLPEVARWVASDRVARWWDEERDAAEVAAHYGPAIDGDDPTRMWIWEVNGRSVGFAQDYRISDHPDWALLCRRPNAVGFDYAIGDPAYVGRGIGTALLWVLLRDIVVPAYADVRELFAAPDHRNAASLRVLVKLGAVPGLWFDEPRRDGGVETVVGHSIDVAQVLGGEVTEE